MSNEARVTKEGSLWWVQSSGSGRAWTTGTSPASGLVGLVSQFGFTSGRTLALISERGVPDHWKEQSKEAIQLNFTLRWTGSAAVPTATGSGASVPMFHYEYRANRPEDGGSGYYYQFMGCPHQSIQFSEAMDGNTLAMALQALAMIGPSNTGYLS